MKLLLLALGVFLVFGCAREDDGGSPAPDKPAPAIITKQEAGRGFEACKAWADRACACAAADPTHEAACAEARKIPDALKMSIQAGNSTGVEEDVRARVQLEARRIIARCIEQTARLHGCKTAPAPATP